jgi:hypothetical protein
MILLDENLYSFEYDAALDCWVLTWNAYVFSDEYREINTRVLERLENRTMHKMIRDTRKLNIISAKDQEWFSEFVAPQLVLAGLKYSAVILPENQLAKMAVEDIVHRLNPKIVDTRFFGDMDSAREWLATV